MALVLRMSQLLGYFPHCLGKSGRKYKWVRFLYFVPTLFHCFLVLGNILMVIISIKMERNHSVITENGANSLHTFLITVIKATCHIFTTVYIKVSILAKRTQLSQFRSEFEELIVIANQLGWQSAMVEF